MHLYKINDQLFEAKYIIMMLNAVACTIEEPVELVMSTLNNKKTLAHNFPSLTLLFLVFNGASFINYKDNKIMFKYKRTDGRLQLTLHK